MCAHSRRKSNQILHGDQTRCQENFTGRPRILTPGLFAAANLLVLLLIIKNAVRRMQFGPSCITKRSMMMMNKCLFSV